MYRHGQEEIDAVTEVLRSGQWFRYGEVKDGHTRQAEQFEAEWARAFGSKYSCFTSSGTGALLCCYAGLNVGPGDEVIVPGYTWIASALAPLMVGAIPVLVDVDETLTLDPDAVERAITPRTRAICPVHMNGFVADMDRILAIARKHNLYVIEDACQCDGGLWKDGRRMGTLGEMGAYSFNFMKVISCGDGGMFVTNERQYYERGLIHHDGGSIFRPHAKEIGVEFFAGMNLRGNEILAAIMRVQLSRLEGIIRDLHRVHAEITRRVQADSDATPLPYVGGEHTGTRHCLGYRFPSEQAARAFAEALGSDPDRCGLYPYLAFDSGRHVFANWLPILQRRGSYNAKANPYANPLNADSTVRYDKNSLPATLGVLKTTVIFKINPDWTEAQINAVSRAICRATQRTKVAA